MKDFRRYLGFAILIFLLFILLWIRIVTNLNPPKEVERIEPTPTFPRSAEVKRGELPVSADLEVTVSKDIKVAYKAPVFNAPSSLPIYRNLTVAVDENEA